MKEKVQSQLELIEMYKEQVKQYHGESFDDESWNKSNEVDGNFTIFQDVIQHNRDQILRLISQFLNSLATKIKPVLQC